MNFLGVGQFSLLAEGFFDLIGPVLIFGIYIIASIAKAAAKGKKAGSGEEKESALKKAVRQRYQEIYQRQTGKTPTQRMATKETPTYVQSKTAIKEDIGSVQYKSEWQRRQEEIRQRNARIKERQRMASQQRYRKETQGVTKSVRQPKVSKTMPLVAVQSTRKSTYKSTQPTSSKKSTVPESVLSNMLSDPKNLRTAFVLKEILDKPVALRDFC